MAGLVQTKFDQQEAQDLLNFVIVQRDQAFNAIARLQVALAAKDREVASVKAECAALKKPKDKK